MYFVNLRHASTATYSTVMYYSLQSMPWLAQLFKHLGALQMSWARVCATRIVVGKQCKTAVQDSNVARWVMLYLTLSSQTLAS